MCIRDSPYVARSVTEFWRRWHISLSTWFRDYVYIPLGGNRCSRARNVWNLLVVWFLTGMWHGASWNFIAWGLWFFVLLVGEKLLWGKALERLPSLVRHAYAMVPVSYTHLDVYKRQHIELSNSFISVSILRSKNGQSPAGVCAGNDGW